MQRSKMRRVVKIAVKSGLHEEQHREVLEDALNACHNPKTRAIMRSRILREGHRG